MLEPLASIHNKQKSCTDHTGAKKAHDWAVEQLTDLFRTTHRFKTKEVAKNRVQRCGDIEFVPTCLMIRDRCHWCWTCVLHTSVGEVTLTLVLMTIYITPLTQIGHSMSLLLTKSYNTVLIIIIVPFTLSSLYLLLLVHLGGYTSNLYTFYFTQTYHTSYIIHFHVHPPYSHPTHTHTPLSHLH